MSSEEKPQEDSRESSTAVRTKKKLYEIEWSYTPVDFFPSPIAADVLDCTLKIEKGAVVANIKPEAYEENPLLQQQLHNHLLARFKVQQYKTGKKYDLDDGSLIEQDWNDLRIKHLALSVSSRISVTDGLQISDSSGKLLFDSSTERLREKSKHQQKQTDLQVLEGQIAAVIEQHWQNGPHPDDPLLDSLLASHLAAYNDPGNELIYLYETRDALSKRFGGDPQAQKELSVSSSEWRDFGRLSNNEPVLQGRHRGNFARELRSATHEELVEARVFAKKLLLAFLRQIT